MSDHSKGEIAFIDQMTRKLLVQWADNQVRSGHIGKDLPGVYVEYAISKKWLLKDGTQLSSTGWSTATRFLKR